MQSGAGNCETYTIGAFPRSGVLARSRVLALSGVLALFGIGDWTLTNLKQNLSNPTTDDSTRIPHHSFSLQ